MFFIGLKDKYWFYIIFSFAAVIRILFYLLSGFDSYQLQPDSKWIVTLSERAYHGNFDFDIGRFIAAPFYQTFIALIKHISYSNWEIIIISFQIIISSLSVVFLYKTSKILFEKKTVAILASLIFCLFPFTFWWVFTFSTETLFQSLLIFSIYNLIKGVNGRQFKNIILSAIFLSICYLTKSHILLFTPFIVLFLFVKRQSNKEFFKNTITYGAICLLFSLPFGLYNLEKHNQYVLASNGLKYHIHTGNSNFGYTTIVNTPEQGSVEFKKMLNFEVSYFNGSIHDSIMKLPHDVKQDLYLQESIKWIKKEPIKFCELKFANLIKFFTPGVSKDHYPATKWLISLFISFPIYLFAFAGICIASRNSYKDHLVILSLIIVMLSFSVLFYVQNRFRTITLEPLLIIYASYIIVLLKDILYKQLSK